MSLNRQVGERIRGIRKSRGWSQQVLADKIGTDTSIISRMERGNGGLSLSTIERACIALSVSLEDFFVGIGPAKCLKKSPKGHECKFLEHQGLHESKIGERWV